MGRPNKQERQAQRARERAQALLARGRFAEVIAVLPAVPGPTRELALKTLATAMESDIARAHAQGAQTTLIEWLGRLEREPRLLDVLGQRAVATRYALLIAALRGRMWSRAEALWGALRAPLATHPLYEALEAVVSTHGAPAGDLLARVEDEAQRLGYDATAHLATHPAPRELGEVDECCLRCFGTEPWWRFRDVTLDWLRHLPAEYGQCVRVLAAELSEAELLARSRAERANVAEVVRYIATLAREAGAPSVLESPVRLCLRVLFRTLLKPAAPDAAFDALCVLAPVASHYESLRSALVTVIFEIPLARMSRTKQSELLRVALGADPSAFLAVARVLGGTEDRDDVPPDAPTWFVEAFETALREPQTLVEALRPQLSTAKADSREEPSAAPGSLCEPLFAILPVPVAVATIDAVWGHADEPLRRELGAASEVLITRMQEQPDRNASYEALYERILVTFPELASASKSELRRLMKSEDIARYIEAVFEGPVIDRSFELLARRLTQRVAPYNVRALDVALQLTTDKRQHVRLADGFLARLPTLSERVKALFLAVREELIAALALLEKRCCEGIVPKPADAASALAVLRNVGAPRALCVHVARLLLDAVVREPDAMAHPDVARAVDVAKLWVGKRKAPVKRKSKARKRKRAVGPVSHEFDWSPVGAEVSRGRS